MRRVLLILLSTSFPLWAAGNSSGFPGESAPLRNPEPGQRAELLVHLSARQLLPGPPSELRERILEFQQSLKAICATARANLETKDAPSESRLSVH